MQRYTINDTWQTIATTGGVMLSFEGGTSMLWLGSETPQEWGHRFSSGDKFIIPAGLQVRAKTSGGQYQAIIIAGPYAAAGSMV